MPRDTTGKHTAKSLTHLAQLFEDHAATLRAAAVLLEADPQVAEIEVRYESSRLVGLEYVTTWVNSAKQAAFDARMAMAVNGSVRLDGHADTGSPKRKKTGK